MSRLLIRFVLVSHDNSFRAKLDGQERRMEIVEMIAIHELYQAQALPYCGRRLRRSAGPGTDRQRRATQRPHFLMVRGHSPL